MASNGKWEVVGKGGKKKAPNEGKKNKVKASDMPKAEINSKSANAGLFKVFIEQKQACVCRDATYTSLNRGQKNPCENNKIRSIIITLRDNF